MDMEMALKKAHVRLMRHPETCLYSGVMMMGDVTVDDETPTAATDGLNVKYGRAFLEKLQPNEIAGLVLHETLHKALKQIGRHNDLMKEDPRLVNVAMDYVVNDIIMNLEDKALCKLPDGGLWHAKFRDWSVREVYNFLKSNQTGGNGQPSNGSGGGETITIDGEEFDVSDSIDGHDHESSKKLTNEEKQEVDGRINEALQQGGMLAGKMGTQTPRAISEAMEPVVDWRTELKDFITSTVRGKDEYTWRKFDKRRLADDLYMPSTHKESMTELVVAIDLSGSIGDAQMKSFAGELASICQTCEPDRVRVLWWDTEVGGQQVFEGGYDKIESMLKPVGGGGTRVSCVSDHMVDNSITADAVVVFTDGYVENNIDWRVTAPTLWLVTENRQFNPPTGGRKVRVIEEV
jgi:predicted metal-dependent peptidase